MERYDAVRARVTASTVFLVYINIFKRNLTEIRTRLRAPSARHRREIRRFAPLGTRRCVPPSYFIMAVWLDDLNALEKSVLEGGHWLQG